MWAVDQDSIGRKRWVRATREAATQTTKRRRAAPRRRRTTSTQTQTRVLPFEPVTDARRQALEAVAEYKDRKRLGLA